MLYERLFRDRNNFISLFKMNVPVTPAFPNFRFPVLEINVTYNSEKSKFLRSDRMHL